MFVTFEIKRKSFCNRRSWSVSLCLLINVERWVIIFQDNVFLILKQLSITTSFPLILCTWSRQSSVWMTATPPPCLPPSLPPALLPSTPPVSPTSLTQSRGPYLCLDHASSLVSQVLQGSGNINLFSTCNRPKIGLSSKQWSNPAHICQSLFILGSLWNSAAIENYYIHPSKDLDKSHRLFLDKICKRIFWGSGKCAIMHSKTLSAGFSVRILFKNWFRLCPTIKSAKSLLIQQYLSVCVCM